MIRLLSNGLSYDTHNGLLIKSRTDKPYPHNFHREYIERSHIQLLAGLTSDETDYLLAQARKYRSCRLSVYDVESERLRKKSVCDWRREKMMLEAQSRYYWSDEHANFFARGKIVFHEWLKIYEPHTYHALWGQRASLPGVKRWKKASTRTSRRHKKRHT